MKRLGYILSIIVCQCVIFVLNEDISIDTSELHTEINEKFVGVAIDSGVVRRHWQKFHPNSKKVRSLARGLSPSYLRVGGTDADFLIFSNDGSKCQGASKYKWEGRFDGGSDTALKYEPLNTLGDTYGGRRMKRDVGYELKKDLTNFTMTASFYDQLHNFVSDVGWDLIFDLNSLLRVDGTWDSSNAQQIINYTAACGYRMAGWELGNEPDEYDNPIIKHPSVLPEQLAKDILHMKNIVQSYPDFKEGVILGPSIAAMKPNAYYRLIKFRLDATQLARDYKVLKQVLNKFPVFSDAEIIGPSTTQLNKRHTEKYFESFLSSGGGDVVTAATFHQYYLNGRVATESDFYDPDVLNILYDEVQSGVNLTRASGSHAKVWLGETSSAWGGGAIGLSDRYLAGFLWLDKLGMAARDGIDTLIRQTFYGGHYSLIDSNTLDPNPDYWLTLVYKLLVSNKVLRVTSTDSKGTLRVYAHCTQRTESGYPVGSVTVFVLNLSPFDVDVTLSDFPSSNLHVYNLTPTAGNLTSQFVDLNGVTLKLINDTTLPNLLQPIKTTGSVRVSGRTFSFIVIPDADVSVCA